MKNYDYSTRENREKTVAQLFWRAKSARTAQEREWERYNDYYNGIHDTTSSLAEFCREQNLPFNPPAMPDAWIMVESQIDPNVPEPEFRGRDDDLDSAKARQREFAVRYIIENNRLKDMNTRNERRLLKYGDAFWKAYWDGEMRCGLHEGDIRIKDLPVDAVFPDPAIRDGGLQDGEYVDYVYRMHKVRFARFFAADLKKRGVTAEELLSADYMERSSIFDMTTAVDDRDDTIQVLEHWFRQPEDTTDEDGGFVPAGAVACSIQAGGRELRYIPHYWKRTGRQNELFPFVHYWRVQDENRFWNKSEIAPIMDLIDAADRKLAMSILNDAFMANDILLVEEGALADGQELTNEPGEVVRIKPNRIGGVARLGGLNSIGAAEQALTWFKDQMERTCRNYDTNNGRETLRQTTATALSMMRSDVEDQQDIKKTDRAAGFERLYELLDWLALEFFDDDRILYLQGKKYEAADGRRQTAGSVMAFNADAFARQMPEVYDLEGNVVREAWNYFPKVDVTITAGDSVVRGKQATLEALQALTSANITPDNWRLFAAQLDVLDIPGKNDIIADWERRFTAPVAPIRNAEHGIRNSGIASLIENQNQSPTEWV